MVEHSDIEYNAAFAALAFQNELGITDTLNETPINRFELTETRKQQKPTSNIKPTSAFPSVVKKEQSSIEIATLMANKCTSLDELKDALALFDHCDLKEGAKQLVFADGNANSELMLIGEAPGRMEDQIGRPFVGRAGQLLDNMFKAIGLSRVADADNAFYITNAIPWRPLSNRDPTREEIATMLPFLKRHIELISPRIIILLGNIPCQALLNQKGITKMRGNWFEVMGRPALPMFHPAALLRDPLKKRPSWVDLQEIRDALKKRKGSP